MHGEGQGILSAFRSEIVKRAAAGPIVRKGIPPVHGQREMTQGHKPIKLRAEMTQPPPQTVTPRQTTEPVAPPVAKEKPRTGTGLTQRLGIGAAWTRTTGSSGYLLGGKQPQRGVGRMRALNG